MMLWLIIIFGIGGRIRCIRRCRCWRYGAVCRPVTIRRDLGPAMHRMIGMMIMEMHLKRIGTIECHTARITHIGYTARRWLGNSTKSSPVACHILRKLAMNTVTLTLNTAIANFNNYLSYFSLCVCVVFSFYTLFVTLALIYSLNFYGIYCFKFFFFL